MDLTTNGIVITDAIKFVQTSKKKLISTSGDNGKESKELDYNNGEDREQLEGKQEEGLDEIKQETTNQVF